MDINKVTLIGRVGKIDDGKDGMARVSLATNKKFKKKDGESVDETQWHTLVFFGKLSDVLKTYVSVGEKIYVEGEIQYRTTEKDDGTRLYFTSIVVNQLLMLSDKKENTGSFFRGKASVKQRSSNDQANAKSVGVDTQSFDDDIPF